MGVSFACTAVRAHHGAPLAAQRDDVAGVLAGSTRVERLAQRYESFAEEFSSILQRQNAAE